MLVDTKEKNRCFELIEEIEKEIEELEQQGYTCDYFKERINAVKGIEANLRLERDFERTPYGFVFKDGISALERQYEKALKMLVKDKYNLRIDKKRDRELEQLLKDAKENLNYDIDNQELEVYIQRITPYFSCIIKKDYITPLAETIYQIIKVEYNQSFTTNMLHIIRPQTRLLKITKSLYKEVCKCLDKDLYKYDIDTKNKEFDGYLIEEIVEKENKNFISLDERIEYLRRKKLNNQKNQELSMPEDETLIINRDRILNIYKNLLKQIRSLIVIKKDNGNDNSEEDVKIYKAALKRVSMYGEITALSSNCSFRTEVSAFMPFDEIYVKYNNNSKEACEILTGKKIPIVDSKTKVEEELPPAFIEREMMGDTIDFYKIIQPDERDFKTYLESDKDRLSKQLEIWEYEGKKAIYQNLIRKEEESHQKVLK